MLSLSLLALTLAQPPPEVRYVGSTAEAVQLARADLLTVPAVHRPFLLYIYHPYRPLVGAAEVPVLKNGRKDLRSLRIISESLQWASQGYFIAKPANLFGGLLVRADIRNYDPNLKDWPRAREQLAFDPTFSVLVTRDLVRFNTDVFFLSLGLTRPGEGKEFREVRRFKHPGGVFRWPPGCWGYAEGSDEPITEMELEAGDLAITVCHREAAGVIPVTRSWCAEQFEKSANIDVLRFNPSDVDASAYLDLQRLSGSLAPIVDADYLEHRMLSSIEEDKLFKDVFGGLYFQFKGIRKSADQKKQTDLDLFLEDLGVGGKGEKLKDLVERIGGEYRVAIVKSRVTGKPRAVMLIDGVWITFDVKDKDVDLGQRAFANVTNLFDFAQAYEVISFRRHGKGSNGLPVVALFNNEQKLQEEAPSGQGGVVDDTTVPSPHTHRLESVISCIRCHGAQADFLQPLANDAPRIFAPELHYDPNNLAQFLDPNNQTRLRLIGQYQGTGIQTQLARGRTDFQRATRESLELAVGSVWEGSQGAYEDVGRLSSAYLGESYNDWWYGTIDAEGALREIGFELTERKGETIEARRQRATATYNQMVPITLLSAVSGLVTEDPRIKAHRAGLSISRQDWALIRGIVAGSVKRKKP